MPNLFAPGQSRQDPALSPAQRTLGLPCHASLSFKTLLIIALTLLGLLTILYLPLRQVVLSSFQELEQQQLHTDLERVQYALDAVLNGLSETVGGYSYWDDTYAFIDTRDPAYPAAALGDSLFTDVPLNLVLLVNPSGQIVYGRAFDTLTQRPVPVPPALRQLQADDPLLTHADANSTATGLFVLPEGPLLVAARPVVRTDGSGPLNGTIMFGRYLDDAVVQQLAQTVQLSLTLHRLDEAALAPELQSAAAELRPGAPLLVTPRDEHTIAGYLLLDDLTAEHALMFRVTSDRQLYAQGQRWMNVFLLLLIAAGVAFGGLLVWLLQRVVLARVVRLNRAVQSIEQTRDLTQRVPTDGDDELAALSQRINRMLAALLQAEHERIAATALREQVQVQDEALRAKRAFLSVVSHELRTPLTPILGYTDMLLAGGGGPLTLDQRDMLERVRHNVRDMTALVDDVLEIGRLEAQRVPLQLAPVDLSELSADVVAALHPTFVAKHLTLGVQIDPQLPVIMGDRLRLRQVLMNLLTNACKYTVQGSVTVTVRHDPAHWVELAVADTGIGMTTAQLAQLFTPFYRADSALRDSEPGTGLGLTIVKALVELHHGTITVQSEDGIGTIVTCRLPVEQPQAQETTPEVLHERAVGQ